MRPLQNLGLGHNESRISRKRLFAFYAEFLTLIKQLPISQSLSLLGGMKSKTILSSTKVPFVDLWLREDVLKSINVIM